MWRTSFFSFAAISPGLSPGSGCASTAGVSERVSGVGLPPHSIYWNTRRPENSPSPAEGPDTTACRNESQPQTPLRKATATHSVCGESANEGCAHVLTGRPQGCPFVCEITLRNNISIFFEISLDRS
jgi:hypothetical protein